MQDEKIILKKITEIAEGTVQVDFHKPESFEFVAGQYVIMAIEDLQFPDAQRNFRSLSIASAPYEDVLTFIMRRSDSGFKQSLHAMQPGDTVNIKGPVGHFILPEDQDKKIVFLTAGVGITPVRSMLRQASHEGSERNLTLLDANRTPESAPCIEELSPETLSLANYSHKCIVSDHPDAWSYGYCGRIDSSFISEHVEDVVGSAYYIVGTKGFIGGMKAALAELEVSEDQIVIDNFG